MGAVPTHPELLDWLATDFVQHGWKIKRLHKQIMMSTAYRQSSRQPAEDAQMLALEVDPANDLLWRMNLRRSDAEAIRDSVLATSGKLNPKMFGAPVELDSTKDGLVTEKQKPDWSAAALRRSVYLLARRNYSTSFLDVFDFPVMALNCTKRSTSATPLQSLTMLNSDFVMKGVEDFATRVIELGGPKATQQQQVDLAFRLALSRKPQQQELEWISAHMDNTQQRHLELKISPEAAAKKALMGVCQMLVATNEFLYID
jgi:hypothetical protein